MQKGGNAMDQVRIGSFIAQLRREKSWTQEELGEQLGVTNKTVSRWENGNYMPSIEVLMLMGREFNVSLNELLEGRRLDDADFRVAADEKVASALRSPGERLRRWLERYGAFPVVTVMLCIVIVLCFWWQHSYTAAHPMDAGAAGSWCTDWRGTTGTEEYIILMKGEYYRYRQYEPLEYGSYTADGPVVTVETRERSFQALIKGKQLYVPDEEGRLTAYQRDGNYDVGVFVNVHPDDFKK